MEAPKVPTEPESCNSIQIEYGRVLEFSAADASEWLDDLHGVVEEVMGLLLRVGDDDSASLSRFAFCAPK
jgi:hypothetical protein